MLYLIILGICWFGGWSCCDEVVRETSLAGIPINSVGDEVDGFLGNDVGAGHGDSLNILGEANMSGSMICRCIFLACCYAGNPRTTGVMLIVSQSGVVSVYFLLLCAWVIGVLFEFGDVASMTGSTMLGLSLLDLS